MLEKVKLALRISTDAFDGELSDLIESARADLGLVGIIGTDDDALIRNAIITFCRMNFGVPSDYDKLERAYYLQKAQLKTSSAYAVPAEVSNDSCGCY